MVTKSKLLLGHDDGGYYALSSLCTHSSCDMSKPATGDVLSNNDIVCNCHGSKFSPTGAVLQGPAKKALPAYALALGDDGLLYVDKSTKVAPTVRLAV
jgi:cytochrome b6-f complex iron-sulfur subunit